MTKQTYAGDPSGHRVIVPPSFKGFIAEIAVLKAMGMNYVTEGNVDRALALMRAGCKLEGDPTNQRLLFHEMLLLLPAELRVHVIAAIKRKAEA